MATAPKNILIFDMARTRSHLFFRYVDTHPDVESMWHPYTPAYLFGPERVVKFTTGSPTVELYKDFTFEQAGENHFKAMKEADAKGKIFVAKEHCQDVSKHFIIDHYLSNAPGFPTLPSNPTQIPDNVFATLTPIFVIRNPIFSVQSNHAANLNGKTGITPGESHDWQLMTGTWFQRLLFDFFLQRNGKPPTVVDGDDTIWRTKEISEELCARLGIDVKGLKTEWELKAESERPNDPMLRKFLEASDDSRGIEGRDTERPLADLEKASHRWKEKYGEHTAEELKETVEKNREHYEYMKQYKI